MNSMEVIEGDFSVQDAKFALAVSRFNGFIVDSLQAAALDTLLRHGVKQENIRIVRVPGAFELPLVVQRLAAGKKFDAIIALGAVIRGATPHFDFVAGECAKGLASIALEFDIPVAFGVLTTDTIEQAIERAGTKAGNKGGDAAMSAIEMVNILRQMDGR